MPQLATNYIATGKVVYIFYQLPLNSIHPNAQITAEASECAGRQGKFWEMHDVIFERQAEWSGSAAALPILKGYATELGLDAAAFESCLSGNETAARVQADSSFASSLGITGTPFFLFNSKGQILYANGAMPYSSLQQGLDGLLANP